jgi:tripartite-type tricarboxylate transporter receptor subunit TctC
MNAAGKRGMLKIFASWFVILLVSASAAWAQGGAADPTWPNKPIRFIVPFPAGSSTDVVGRIVGQMLAARLSQQIVVENRVGASGNLDADAVARATPDGYTIGLATTSTHTLAPSLTASLPYDPVRDFAPVSMIGGAPYVMVTYPGLEAKNVADFVALARAKPGRLNYGSAGAASLAHLAGVLFANGMGVQISHVPYKSSAQSVTDLITGRLDMQFSTIAPTLPLVRSGQLRALATTGAKRAGTIPELPTIAESGIAGYEATLWMAIVAPPATPAGIVARLNRELVALLNTTEANDTLLAQGVDIESSTPEALRARIGADIERWKSVITNAGIQAE